MVFVWCCGLLVEFGEWRLEVWRYLWLWKETCEPEELEVVVVEAEEVDLVKAADRRVPSGAIRLGCQ